VTDILSAIERTCREGKRDDSHAAVARGYVRLGRSTCPSRLCCQSDCTSQHHRDVTVWGQRKKYLLN